MNHEFTADEIRDVARTALIYCPGFSEEQFESLMELEKRIADSGYLEVVLGLLRLEEEKGIACTEALDACEELMERKAKLEQQVPALEKGMESLKARIQQANGEYNQVQQSTAKAEQQLAQISSKYAAAEKKLETFKRQAEKRKKRINKEVEDYHRQANVTREEVTIAGKIKAEAGNHGVGLELVLDISQELSAQKNARKELVEGFKQHHSLTKYLNELSEQVEKRRMEVTSEVARLKSQQDQAQAQVQALTETRLGIENIITQLQADVAAEDEYRRFYRRYYGSNGLLEYLASWEQLIFLRCNNALSAATGVFNPSKVAHFWTDKPAVKCPHCGSPMFAYDEKPYQVLGLQLGTSFKLHFGE